MMKRHPRGFTLIELVIAIVVLAILVSMAAPSFIETLDRRRLLNATNALADQVQQARTVSILVNEEINMIFASSGDGWGFGITDKDTCDYTEPAAPGGSLAGACTVRPPDADPDCEGEACLTVVRARSEDFPGIAFSDNGTTTLTFEPVRGTLSSGGGTFTLESARGLVTEVRVNIVGRTTICRPGDAPNIGGIQTCID